MDVQAALKIVNMNSVLNDFMREQCLYKTS